jgi:glutathione S-transferase
MRARLALWKANISCELREVVLKDKPPSLPDYSSKATVPVLVLEEGTIIDESLGIMFWALERSDPDEWLSPPEGSIDEMSALIKLNDDDFKRHLDRYKYPDRYEDVDPLYHRQEAERFLAHLDARLESREHLFGAEPSLADFAIGPFIRQFANTNRGWFDASEYKALKSWLEGFLALPLFEAIMEKYPQWHEGDAPILIP